MRNPDPAFHFDAESGSCFFDLMRIRIQLSTFLPDPSESAISFVCFVFRAPGCEKKVVEIAADYEQKRLLATKAIQQKPAGEERTPNSVWSGLGFSSSMPAAVIRYLRYLDL
jgi:hypothetical protein